MSATEAPVRVSRVGGEVLTPSTEHIVYKKVGVEDGTSVATLRVPRTGTIVYPDSSGSWNSTKIRVDEALVADIEGEYDTAYSLREPSFEYTVGELVEPSEFSSDPTTVSAPGIHCFPTRAGAVHWRGYEEKYD